MVIDVLAEFVGNLFLVVGILALAMAFVAILVERESHWHEDRSVDDPDRCER